MQICTLHPHYYFTVRFSWTLARTWHTLLSITNWPHAICLAQYTHKLLPLRFPRSFFTASRTLLLPLYDPSVTTLHWAVGAQIIPSALLFFGHTQIFQVNLSSKIPSRSLGVDSCALIERWEFQRSYRLFDILQTHQKQTSVKPGSILKNIYLCIPMSPSRHSN